MELAAVGFAKGMIPVIRLIGWAQVWTQESWVPLSRPDTLRPAGALPFTGSLSHPFFGATYASGKLEREQVRARFTSNHCLPNRINL